ncbi:hypothetical protein R4036_004599 [Salmonella enterica]|nr:hypothetical protein [Salmonella enterica]
MANIEIVKMNLDRPESIVRAIVDKLNDRYYFIADSSTYKIVGKQCILVTIYKDVLKCSTTLIYPANELLISVVSMRLYDKFCNLNFKERESVNQYLRKHRLANINNSKALQEIKSRVYNTTEIFNTTLNIQQERHTKRITSSFMRACIHRLLKPIPGFEIVDLGYTVEELKEHLELQFDDGMNWNNYGEWEIDHILSIHHLLEMGETNPKIINGLLNLCPLWANDNRKKNKFWNDDEMTKEDFYLMLVELSSL